MIIDWLQVSFVKWSESAYAGGSLNLETNAPHFMFSPPFLKDQAVEEEETAEIAASRKNNNHDYKSKKKLS